MTHSKFLICQKKWHKDFAEFEISSTLKTLLGYSNEFYNKFRIININCIYFNNIVTAIVSWIFQKLIVITNYQGTTKLKS